MGAEGEVGFVGGGEEGAGGGGESGGEWRGVEARAEGQEGAEHGGAGGGGSERGGEGLVDRGFGKVGGEGADFFVGEGASKFGREAGEADGGGFAAESEGGEDAVFEGESAAGGRGEEGGGRGGIQLHGPAGEVAFEFAFVVRPRIRGGNDRRKGSGPELGGEVDDLGAGARDAAEGVAEGGADGRGGIGEERGGDREEFGLGARVRGGEAGGLVAEGGRGVGGEREEERGGERLETFEGPEGGEAAVGGRGAIGDEGGERGGDGGGAAVGEFEPGEAGDEGVGGAELGDEGAVVEAGEVGWCDARLIAVADAPDAAAGFVAVGVRARNLVVRNDFVIPVDDIERAVRAKMHRDGAEPFVGGGEEVGEFFVGGARAVGGGRGADGVDRVRDGIGEEEDLRVRVAGGSAETTEESVAVLGEGEAAEAGAAHLGGGERGRHEGLVGAEQIF